MSLRRWLLGPVLALAIVPSLGHAQCAWMSIAAQCPMKTAAASAPRPETSPAASHGHDCCGHGDEASAPTPAAAPDGHGECDCFCMHQPVAAPAAAVLLSAPTLVRELAVSSNAAARPDAALERTLECATPVDARPLAAPALERATPRGPPASA